MKSVLLSAAPVSVTPPPESEIQLELIRPAGFGKNNSYGGMNQQSLTTLIGMTHVFRGTANLVLKITAAQARELGCELVDFANRAEAS